MYTYKAKLLKVIDGDTIDVKIDLGFRVYTKTRLRLYGINTPETRTKNLEEKKAGLKAKQFVEDALLNKEFKVEVFKQPGKFGRWLACIHIKEDNGLYFCLNEKLVEKRLAKKYYGGKR